MAKVTLQQMRSAAKEWNSAWRTYAIATKDGGFVTSWNGDRYPRMRDCLTRCAKRK